MCVVCTCIRFWPKSMNYSKEFRQISLNGHIYLFIGTCIYVLLFAGIKKFRFWPKTMDYSKAF